MRRQTIIGSAASLPLPGDGGVRGYSRGASDRVRSRCGKREVDARLSRPPHPDHDPDADRHQHRDLRDHQPAAGRLFHAPTSPNCRARARAPTSQRSLFSRRNTASTSRCGSNTSIGLSPSTGDEVDDHHRDAHLVCAPRRRRGHDPDDLLAEVLEELGHRDRRPPTRSIRRSDWRRNTEFDLAILDVNVQGKLITPVAELITTLNRPIIFATGYGTAGIPEEFRGRPSLEKPFLIEKLARTIELDPEKPSLRK